MKITPLLLPASIVAALVLSLGCGPKEEEPAPATDAGAPATTRTPETDSATSPNEGAGGAVTFASLQPMFEQKCGMCHGANEPKEEIDMRSYQTVMKGGEHGPIVVPGKPEESLLVHVLRGSHGAKQMPMKAEPLPEEDIQRVEAWIEGGAKP